VNFVPELVSAELFQLLIIGALFVATMYRDRQPSLWWLPWAAGIVVILSLGSFHAEGTMFYGAYKIDMLSQFFKAMVAIGFLVTVKNALRQPSLEEGKRPDYFMLLAISAWGLMLVASSVELITIYIGIEISAYALYALIPLRAQEPKAAEAGIKYVIFGAAATALALYGFSFMLATQHTSYIAELANASWSFQTAPLAVAGMALFLCGLFYKLALFPFHFWAPDVYDGASNETAAYVCTLPKLGAVVILIRLSALLTPGMELTTIMAVLAAVSMTFGNLAALVQKDIKRLLGYSSVAHAGFVMVGLVAGTAQGLAAAAFYALAYILMNLTIFWVLCRVSGDGRNLTLDGMNGLYRRYPWLSFVLAVAAFALVGLPPTVGFIGKFFLLTSAWNKGYNWLVVVGAVNAAISIFYYLNIVRHAYTVDQTEDVTDPPAGKVNLIWAGVLAGAVLVLGAIPSSIYEWALRAGEQIMMR
jgi:NADH-quinone oxidoreductase subunit N